MDSRFATLVKEDGKWLIVNFHRLKNNIFKNAVMDMAIKKTMWMTAPLGWRRCSSA